MEIFAQILGFVAGIILLAALQFKKRVYIAMGIALANAVFSARK